MVLLMTMIIKCAIINSVEFVLLETLLKKITNIKISIFSITVIITSLFACSNSQESKLVYTESNTIKQAVKDKEQEITWTNELEGERLTKVINRGAMQLGSDVPYSKDLYKINQKSQNAVYPDIDQFGSLDTRTLRTSVKEKVNNFCTALISEKHAGTDSYFSKKYIFNYVFFMNDLEAVLKNNLGQELKDDKYPFSKWIFGEPFNGADIIQIPVRFYADCGTIDMTMFLNPNGNNEFYQITIDRWQKK